VTRRGSIVVERAGGGNLVIYKSHTPTERIVIERADEHDAMLALMEFLGVEPDIIRLVDPAAS
jgi:hypothetical protein